MRRGFFSRINTPVPSLPTRNEWAQSWKEENLNQTRPLSSSHSSFLRQEEREKCSAIGHFSTQRFRRGSDLRSDGSRSLRLRGLGNGDTPGQRPSQPSDRRSDSPLGLSRYPMLVPSGTRWQACLAGEQGAALRLHPAFADFRRFRDPTDLRLTITSRASCPASIASIRCPSMGYLRSTSVVPPSYLRHTSVIPPLVIRRYYGGTTEVLRRYYGGNRHW